MPKLKSKKSKPQEKTLLQKIYNVRVPESIYKALRFTSVNKNSSIVELTREALRHYVKKHAIKLSDEAPEPEKRVTVQVRLFENEYKWLEHIKALSGDKTPDIMRLIYAEYLVDNGYIRQDGGVTSPITALPDPQAYGTARL